MIPEAAVEAAARAHQSKRAELGYEDWDDLADMGREWRLDHMRAALEAAAPHMLARVSTVDELVILEPGTVLQGPDFHEETYKCTAPGTFHAIASPTEYRPSELVARGPFTVIYRPTP